MPSTTTVSAESLADSFNARNTDLLEFVQGCSDDGWRKVTAAEGWPVGVTARHIAVAHYPVIEWVQMLVQGDPLPPVTMDTIDQINAQHAAAHQDCTQDEVVELLRANHAKVVAYLATLDDADLGRQGYLKLFETDISAAQLFSAVLIDSAAKHFSSMKETVQQGVFEGDTAMLPENKAILRRFFEEIFNQQKISVADEIVAENYVNHNAAPGELPGREGLKQFVAYLHAGNEGITFTIEDQVAEGEKVVTRLTLTGTHTGEFAGIPATGESFSFEAMNIHRVVDGRVHEAWIQWDALGWMQQIGAIPSQA